MHFKLKFCLLTLFMFNVINATIDKLSERFIETEWKNFKDTYNKKYDELEEEFRYANFKFNIKLINEHNKAFEQGDETFEMGINEFSDKSEAEIKESMLMPELIEEELDEKQKLSLAERTNFFQSYKGPVPSYINWVKMGLISPVRHQSECGACWAFAATAAIEAQYYKKFRNKTNTVEFSTQNLIDCSTPFGTHGCEGGFAHLAFQYVIKHGIHLEKAYPYKGTMDKCNNNIKGYNIKLKNFKMLKRGDENMLKTVVALFGPVAISYRATGKFAYHKRGVYYVKGCNDHTNHAMVIVGYGTENGMDYWLAKNSWGKGFGINGYIKLARNKNNNCGVARRAVVPIL